MTSPPKNIKLIKSSRVIFLFCLLGSCLVHAQRDFVPAQAATAELHQAERYLKSFKNDSSLAITTRLLKELRNQARLNSYFGFRVRLAEAVGYEQKQQDEKAIERLHRIIDQTKDNKSTADIYIKACLYMALIHEKAHLKEHNLRYLNEAKRTIDHFGLDSLYPHYAIRMASWKRYNESKTSAIPYAEEVLKLAPLYSLKLEEAVGHMLMRSLVLPEDPERSLYHSLKAIPIYKSLGDFPGQCMMYHSAARIYFMQGQLEKALLYNDSSIVSIKLTDWDEFYAKKLQSEPTLLRGEIYKRLGMADSAWFFMNKGYKMEQDYLKSRMDVKVSEMEALNGTEKKELGYLVQLEQKNGLLTVVGLTLLLTLGLIYTIYNNYRRQKETGRLLAQQNKVINKQTAHLKRLDSAKSLFFANASHELRTPLTLLMSPVETLLKEKTLTEKQEKLLQIVDNGGKDMYNLINQILDLGKLDSGTMELYLKPTNVQHFFGVLFAQFESLADSKCIKFSTEIKAEQEVLLMLDREKCRQSLYNLLSNAFKFTSAGGSVSAAVTLEANRLAFEVSDTGKGIAAEDIPYVFDRYFQTAKTEETAKGGMGIGLRICKEYISLFGGEISVRSEPGVGSVFFGSFPVQYAEGGIPEEPVVSEEPAVAWKKETSRFKANRPTILVAEDNVQLRAYIRMILEADYNVELAEHGEEALQKVRAGKGIDLVLSDLMMPVMDGYQLLSALKSDEKTAGLPVIMLTARTEKDARLKALRIGVDDYIAKPFNEDELKVRIANLLKNYKVRKQAVDEQTQEPGSERDREWLEKFEKYVRSEYLDKNPGIPDLAHEFAISESTLFRQLKRLTGLSPQQYIQELRLQHAYELLAGNKGYTIQQVALTVGYKDARSFSRIFKARYGRLPSDMMP